METVLTFIFVAIGSAIVGATVSIAIYKHINNAKADLSQRD